MPLMSRAASTKTHEKSAKKDVQIADADKPIAVEGVHDCLEVSALLRLVVQLETKLHYCPLESVAAKIIGTLHDCQQVSNLDIVPLLVQPS
jgi:hypothetical protein